MTASPGARSSPALWRELLLAQARAQPGRIAVTIVAIALGVALCSAVYLVNAAALAEFEQAAKRLVGEADIIVRGPRGGFPESLFATLARTAGVSVASPVLELEVALPGRRPTLKVLGVDPFRAARLQPMLMGELAGQFNALFEPDGIFLSAAAAEELGIRVGARFDVVVGSATKSLRVLGLLSAAGYAQPLGIMDIAAAQASLGRLGVLNRIDLRLLPGVAVEAFRTRLARELPAGVIAVAPQLERDRAATVTRAYRVNLNMLALVALLTGAFLVFATQSLSVLRRRTGLALLRALGMTRGQLQAALLGEGIALGVCGSLLGVALGQVIASLTLSVLAGDLGAGVLAVSAAALRPQPLAWLAFFLIGIVVAGLGAWLPAREAARRPPAQALKAGDAEVGLAAQRTSTAGIVLLIAGGALAWLPGVHSLPLFGYASVAALLFGAVLLVPVVSSALLARAPRIGNVPFDVALAQLQGSVGQSTLSLAAIIVSFSLMVAMAIMVFSFRVSFERWLGTILPADVQLRVALGSDTAFWSADLQAAIAHAPGVARAQFRRIEPLYLAADRAPVLLIARDIDLARVSTALPLVTSTTPAAPADTPPAWISEAVLDLYGYRPGQRITLPLLGRHVPFYVAGIYRDYGRSTGAIVIPRNVYVALSGDRSATDGALWLAPGAKPRAVEAAVRACFARADALEIRTSTEVRELSLQIFDRAFAITYGLEGIAVLIGLVGVSFGAASTALARRVEFGMLRHVGMLRRQVIAMLAYEGLVLSALGVIYGLLLGGVLSIVLVYVINRQSFSWSVDLAVPWSELGALGVILMVAAAATAILSGRTAMSSDAVRAVREDW